MNTIFKGKNGEEIASQYLKKSGYTIIDQNYYSRYGEIDIIAKDEQVGELVFIEVKARTNKNYGNPEDAVDENKLEKIFKTAEIYLSTNDYRDNYRFDCIAIDMGNNNDIKHYKNIS